MAPDPTRMQSIAKRQSTKSDKIRALSKEGYSRSDIARFLGVRYQFVRNVLVGVGKATTRSSEMGGVSGEGIRNRARLKLDSAGRVLIPAGFREAMQIVEGDTVLAWLEQGELRIAAPKLAMRQAQELASRMMAGNDSLADELIAERRDEARREAKDG